MVSFIVQTQDGVKDDNYRYLGLPLSDTNIQLIKDFKKTQEYKDWFLASRQINRAMDRIKSAGDGLKTLIKFQEQVQKVTDKLSLQCL